MHRQGGGASGLVVVAVDPAPRRRSGGGRGLVLAGGADSGRRAHGTCDHPTGRARRRRRRRAAARPRHHRARRRRADADRRSGRRATPDPPPAGVRAGSSRPGPDGSGDRTRTPVRSRRPSPCADGRGASCPTASTGRAGCCRTRAARRAGVGARSGGSPATRSCVHARRWGDHPSRRPHAPGGPQRADADAVPAPAAVGLGRRGPLRPRAAHRSRATSHRHPRRSSRARRGLDGSATRRCRRSAGGPPGQPPTHDPGLTRRPPDPPARRRPTGRDR